MPIPVNGSRGGPSCVDPKTSDSMAEFRSRLFLRTIVNPNSNKPAVAAWRDGSGTALMDHVPTTKEPSLSAVILPLKPAFGSREAPIEDRSHVADPLNAGLLVENVSALPPVNRRIAVVFEGAERPQKMLSSATPLYGPFNVVEDAV